jgi:hypothetical protein
MKPPTIRVLSGPQFKNIFNLMGFNVKNGINKASEVNCSLLTFIKKYDIIYIENKKEYKVNG